MAEKVLAPLSGNVWKVSVEVGDTVEDDDELFIIEAMKMEIPVFAPCDGKVIEIRVQKDEVVEEDDLLALIE